MATFGGRGSVVVDVWEDVRAYKGSNLADGSSEAVVLATVKTISTLSDSHRPWPYSPDSSRTRFAGKQADIVPRSQLTQRQKDAIYDDESSHILWFVQIWIAPHHDEPNASLRNHTKRKRLLRSKPIADKATAKATRHVEEINEGVPAKTFPERSIVP